MVDVTAYTDLITSEHADQPKFLAMVQVTCQPGVDQQNVINAFYQDYDLDEAIGDQLDVCGQWIGVGRTIKVPIPGLYFALDIVGVGLDEGIWYETGMALFSSVVLTDEPYRTLLRAKAAANIWDGTFNGMYAVYDIYFSGTPNSVKIHDYQNMTYALEITGPAIDTTTQAILQYDYLGLRPMGVQLLPLILP